MPKAFLRFGVVVVGIAIIAGGWLILKSGDSVQVKEPVKIGVLTITSGDLAFLGQNIVRSAEIAVADFKKEGEDIELVVEDVGGFNVKSQTQTAFKKLVEIDKVHVIIDGVSSNDTIAIAPLIDQYKIPVITPLTGGENIDNAAEYLFRNGPSDIKAGTRPAGQLFDKFGYKKIAMITDNAEYSFDIAKHFRSRYEGTIVLDETVLPDQEDYRTQILKLKFSEVQALLLNTATGTSAAYIIKQAREAGIEFPIFANFIAFSPNLFKVAGNSAEGVHIYDPELDESSEAVKSFVEKYKAKYGSEPPIKFHSTGTHDAVRMGIEAIRKVGFDGKKIHDYLLKNIQNWHGMNGTVSFDENGNTQTGFVLKRIKNGGLISVN